MSMSKQKKITRFVWYSCLFWVLACMLFIGCSKSYEYNEILEEEMARGIRYDSLFYGLHFNMTSQQFFEHCFEMNQQGIFFQNNMNSEVQIMFNDEFKYPVVFNFFPNLEKSLIQELRGHFFYKNWNGYDKNYSAQSLQLELVTAMEKWYGGRPFIKVSHPQKYIGDAYVKIDGNRRITLYNNVDSRKVEVWYTDLSSVLR